MRANWGVIVAFAAVAGASRMLFAVVPNVSPTYWVVFVAGLALGARAGALVGILSMLATNLLLTGLHPVLLVNTPAMALIGLAGGLLGRGVNFGQRRDETPAFAAVLAGVSGIAFTIAFSLVTDALDYALFYRSGWDVLRARWIAGLAFNAIPAAAQGALFALATYPTLRALRRAGFTPRARAQAAAGARATPPPQE